MSARLSDLAARSSPARMRTRLRCPQAFGRTAAAIVRRRLLGALICVSPEAAFRAEAG